MRRFDRPGTVPPLSRVRVRSRVRPRARPAQHRPPRVTVVLPVFEEAGTVGELVDELVSSLQRLPGGFELVLVDDGSRDDTPAALTHVRSRHRQHVRVLRHPYNKGNGAAIKTGIAAARGELIAVMDADGQHRPGDLLQLLSLADTYDLVVGARSVDYRGVWYRSLANRLFNAFASWLTQYPVEDLTSGFRVFRADAVRKYVHMFPNGFSTSTTSTLAFLRGGHNVAFVPIHVRPRRGGNSKIALFSDGWRFLLIIVKIVVIFSPLRVFLPVAAMVSLTAVAVAVWSSANAGHVVIPGESAMLLVVSLLIVLLGLVSEQISALEFAVGELRR